MIACTLETLLESKEALLFVENLSLPFSVSYRISKQLAAVFAEIATAEKKQQGILKSLHDAGLGRPDGRGGEYYQAPVVPPRDAPLEAQQGYEVMLTTWTLAQQQLEEMRTFETQINCEPIKVDDLRNKPMQQGQRAPEENVLPSAVLRKAAFLLTE